jgi:hypothetical protein
MHKRIDIIDGQEVEVKVYATRPLPKKQTVKIPGTRRSALRKWRAKKRKQHATAD